MECRECGYNGIFPEMEPEAVEEFDGGEVEEMQNESPVGFRKKRFLIGAVLFLLGLGASSYATWGNGLLAGLLALAVGAAVAAEELSKGPFRN